MADDGYGGRERSWTTGEPVWAEVLYMRGSEGVQTSGLEGRATYKVRVLASPATRAITTDHRMRDLATGLAHNVRDVDQITDRAFVWITVEGGVAV